MTPRIEPDEIAEAVEVCINMAWSALEDHGHDRPDEIDRNEWFLWFFHEGVHCPQTLDNSLRRLGEWVKPVEPPTIDFMVSKYRQEIIDRIRDLSGPEWTPELYELPNHYQPQEIRR